MKEEEMFENGALPMPEPRTEIHRLLVKNGLRIDVIDVKNHPHVIGISPEDSHTTCELWRMSTKTSQRKMKKALKKFLRTWDKTYILASRVENIKAYDKDGNEIDVLDILEKQPTYGDFKIRESWEGNPLAGEPHVVGFSLENPET